MANNGIASASRAVGVKTYKTKTRSPVSRPFTSIYKSKTIQSLPKSAYRKTGLTDDVKDAIATGEEDGSDSSEATSDQGSGEDEFDPKLKKMVDHFTPNTSRTLVNRSKHHLPPLGTTTTKSDSGIKKRKAVVMQGDSDDDEVDELSSSHDDYLSDGINNLALKIQRLSKKNKSVATNVVSGRRGKENAAVGEKLSATRAKIPSRTNRSDGTTSTNKYHTSTTSYAAAKSRIQPTEPALPHVTAFNDKVARMLDVPTSDSERTDSTGDCGAFGFQQTALTRQPSFKAHHHDKRNEDLEFGANDKDDDDDDGMESIAEVQQVPDEFRKSRAEVKMDVKEVKAAFHGIRGKVALMSLNRSSHAGNPSLKLIPPMVDSFNEGKTKQGLQTLDRGVAPDAKGNRKDVQTHGGSIHRKNAVGLLQDQGNMPFPDRSSMTFRLRRDQQNLLHKSLQDHGQILSSSKHEMMANGDILKGTVHDLREKAASIQERKKRIFEKVSKHLADLEKKQAKETRAVEAEMEQLRDKAKTKAEKLLDPAVLDAKFAKQHESHTTHFAPVYRGGIINVDSASTSIRK
ncbi:hypothetical protein QFC19_008038 [Naganishia cerealis]|uniref:Uncharacterized protein n=1 Tax=Naganishia cerealis TaxID=610337 RepID=A0ACC2V6J2_9TREE|nr:hypothetical protein QFC19_008038 [Naganishia cerealis]